MRGAQRVARGLLGCLLHGVAGEVAEKFIEDAVSAGRWKLVMRAFNERNELVVLDEDVDGDYWLDGELVPVEDQIRTWSKA